MSENPVVKAFAYVLVHTPDFVQYGSKPRREISHNPELSERIARHLRSFQDAVKYPPNQVFLGNLHPEDLAIHHEPWWKHPIESVNVHGAYGPFISQEEFYGFLKSADQFDMIWFTPEFTELIWSCLQSHPLAMKVDIDNLGPGRPLEEILKRIQNEASLPLYHQGVLVGSFHRQHDEDETLQAQILMENLVAKASGALVVRELMKSSAISPEQADYIISCSEEAVGDRYNRGGGNLAKAVGEMCCLLNATGCDIKAFCAGPIYAIVYAGSLVKSRVFENVIVFGGGCMAKLGMKFAGHLKHSMPILEDVLGGFAVLVSSDDGQSPMIRLDSVGKHRIGDGSSQQEIIRSLVVEPLERLGMKMTDVDKIATELHNPEVTVPQGSGNVPLNNYKLMAALAVMRGEIERKDMNLYISEHGMPGFSPTQGHIASAVPYLGHAVDGIAQGRLARVLFVAKGSLFLGRMSRLSDGMSFLLEKNKGAK